MLKQWIRIVILVGISGYTVIGLPAQKTAKRANLEKAALLQVEELSESLANRLLDLSVAVRGQDMRTVRSFFADEIEASTLPFPPFPEGETIKWIEHDSHDLDGSQSKPKSRQHLIQEWKRLLESFSEIEDVRFKVQDAKFRDTLEGQIGNSRVKFFLIGRDQTGKRRWVKGTGQLQAHQRDDGSWKISRLTFNRLETYHSNIDLFSEIGLPAGVSVTIPTYGSPGNDNFVYHGAAAADLNSDGFIDLIATGIERNHVYLNNGGTFQEATGDLGLPPTPQATAPLLIDYDNDGDLDMFLAAVGHQMLFQNQLIPEGKLVFADVSLEAGVALPGVGFGATAGDINGDGWPDIYVACYNRYGRIMPNSWHRATNGTANLLFVNQRDGSFKESAEAWGVRDKRWSYAAQMADLDGDGRQDLYVANDFGENAFYINLGERLEDRARSAGVVDPGNGMGVSFGDYNNDGHLDLYVTNMSSTAGNRVLGRLFPEADAGSNVLKKLASGNSLFRGSSNGSFSDVTTQMGPFVAGWAWGGVFVDFDNDGWEDLYCPAGFISGKSMKDT